MISVPVHPIDTSQSVGAIRGKESYVVIQQRFPFPGTGRSARLALPSFDRSLLLHFEARIQLMERAVLRFAVENSLIARFDFIKLRQYALRLPNQLPAS